MRGPFFVIALASLLLALSLTQSHGTSPGQAVQGSAAKRLTEKETDGPAVSLVLPPPVYSSEYYPCSKCHNETFAQPKDVATPYHGSIKSEGHTGAVLGCYGCHDIEDLDKLRLLNGSKLNFTSSSRLCGQCHSTVYKFWRSGLHGKILGRWDGNKKYTPCTICHNPHQPDFMSLKPEPPPTPPAETLRRQQ